MIIYQIKHNNKMFLSKIKKHATIWNSNPQHALKLTKEQAELLTQNYPHYHTQTPNITTTTQGEPK